MKANPVVLAFFLSIVPITVSADLIKWYTTSGVYIIEDTETGIIWQDSFSEYHTFSEAQIACHNSNFGGVLGWDLPTYETMRQFLSAYQRYNPSQSKFYPNTIVYDLRHWTTTKIYTTYRRLARLKIDGTIDESSYVDPASSGRRIGGKCYALLPNNSPNGIATPPELLRSSTSKQSLLPNEQLYLKSYWVDKDDSLELVRVRYKNVYSQDWVQIQAAYIEGHPQFEAHYAAQVFVQKPGYYEVEYQAASRDGNTLSTSEWISRGDTFTVEKVGVTPPDFLEASTEDVFNAEANNKRFTATWSDTDGDPFIFFGKFRYRVLGSSVWSDSYPMTESGSFGDTKTFTAEHIFDEIAGIYEVQFQASSASDFNGFDAVESEWSPSAPISFELIDTGGVSGQENYACNIVNNPLSDHRWAIKHYNLSNLSTITSEMVFSVSNNRKIQSVACDPTGETVFFSMKETLGGDYEIYQLDVATRRLEQITNNDTDDFDVTRSADGLTLAWQKRLPDNRQAIELRRTASDGSLIKKTLGSASPYVQPSLSANGKWLVFVQLRPNNFIVLRYDIENDRYIQVRSVLRRKKLYHPSISDDGNLVGWSELVSKRRYRVKNLTNDITIDVINHSAGIEHAELSANGESVFYSINDSVVSQALVTSLDTQETHQITYFDSGIERNLGNSWIY